MRLLALSLVVGCTVLVGCNEPEETIPMVVPYSGEASGGWASGTTGSGMTGSGTTGSGTTGSGVTEMSPASEIRFVADKSVHVEGMMCPYSCWPRVKETLAAQPGVKAVQLAEQPAGTEEGTIAKPVVELKLADGFDADAALAALEKIDFPAKVIN